MNLCIPLTLAFASLYVVDALPPIFHTQMDFASSFFNTYANGSRTLFGDKDANFNTRTAETLYDYHVDLDQDGTMKLSWKFDTRNISFKLSGPTNVGWIGIGISRDGATWVGADFILLCFTAAREHYVVDAHIDGQTFVKDQSQDVYKRFAFVSSSAQGSFTRPLVTCDQDDVDITKDTLRILWAYGRGVIDITKPLHQQIELAEKGEIDLKLLNPSTAEFDHTTMPPGYRLDSIVVKASNVFPTNNRHCLAFRFLAVKDKIHITEFQPEIEKDHLFNVRQIIIRECHDVFEELDEDHTTPVDCEVGRVRCTTTIVAWVPSMVTFAYPVYVGYPVTSNRTSFMMEVQYRGISDQGFRDSSGMKIHYTTILRPHDVGVLTTGSLVHESQLIPPRSADFRLQGHCMAECIAMSVTEDKPVKIFAATLHAREAGRKIRVRHFRSGRELAPVTADNRFRDDDYQTDYIGTHIELRKGDNLIVECDYDTSDRGEITSVNNSAGGESCLAYLGYYPRNVNLTACETAPTENVIMATVGAARPEEMIKQAETFSWTKEQTQVYNKKVLESQVYVHCGDFEFENPKPVPMIGEVYREKRRCNFPQSTAETEVNISTYATNRPTEFSTSGMTRHSLMLTTTLVYWFPLILHRLLVT